MCTQQAHSDGVCKGDLHGTSTGDCGLRMYEKRAKIVGLNCHFDPFVLLK